MPNGFWNTKSLDEMSDEEWELLCDGCARCCLIKLEDADTRVLHFTNVSCHLLDTHRCRCQHYSERKLHVPECLEVRKMHPDEYAWLPPSCAYRRLAEGRGLSDWHPLVSGRSESVHQARISVAGLAVSEDHIHPEQLAEHIIEFTDD